jgi:hypothetical protein
MLRLTEAEYTALVAAKTERGHRNLAETVLAAAFEEEE